MGMSKEGTAPRLWCVQGLSFIQRARIRDVFDLTATLDELLFCHHIFRFICSKLRKKPTFWRYGSSGDQWTWIWPCRGPQSHAPCSAAWCEWTLWLGQCGLWPLCPWGFPKTRCKPVWSLDWGQHASHEMSTGKVWLQGPLGQPGSYTTKDAAVYSHCTRHSLYFTEIRTLLFSKTWLWR